MERTTDMTDLRRCIGSTRFGIEAHEAPVAEFPRQPSQKDGLGRMCKTHWNLYTAGLARDAKARRAGDSVDAATVARTEPGSTDAIAETGVGGRAVEAARAAKPEAIRTPSGSGNADAGAEVAHEPSAG